MKRILFIISEEWYFMSHRLNLATEALEKGYKVGLLCNPGKNTDQIKEKGVEVYNFSLSRTSLSPLNHIKTIIQISRIIKLFKPDLYDLVFVNFAFPFPDIFLFRVHFFTEFLFLIFFFLININ